MKFKTKWELLEYLGKNKKDNKLIDRMIIRWDVNKTSEGYEYNTPAEDFSWREKELMDKIEWLEFTLDLKESQIESLNKEIEELKNTPSLWASWEEYEELKVNYEYLQQKFRRLKRGYELVIQLTYKYAAKNMKITKEEYKEQLSEEINEALSEEMWREE